MRIKISCSKMLPQVPAGGRTRNVLAKQICRIRGKWQKERNGSITLLNGTASAEVFNVLCPHYRCYFSG